MFTGWNGVLLGIDWLILAQVFSLLCSFGILHVFQPQNHAWRLI